MKVLNTIVDLFAVKKYECPVCSRKVKYFQPLPLYYRENLLKFGADADFDHCETLNWRNYSCPFCGASDRDRLFALYLKRKLMRSPVPRGITFVEFAPSAALAQLIRSIEGIRYRSCDIAMEGVDDRLDLMDLHPYPDGFCDFFICSHVLEHVPDDRKAMRELYRILKPNGEGILMVPIMLSTTTIDEDPAETSEAERWRRFGQNDHVRSYSKQGFVERMREAGFVVNELGVDFFGEDEFRSAAITLQSILYVVSKKPQK